MSDWRRPERPIGYGRQSIDASDVKAVEAALTSNWLTQGPAVARFERALCDATGSVHAVAVSSGTAALHAAMLALGIGPGSRVVTTANTFLASASAAVMCGAEVDFVDVEEGTWNLDPARLEERLARGPVDLVVAVHYAGRACDLDAILALSEKHGFDVVVDGCHALGGTAVVAGEARRLGEVPAVRATALSFHPVKPITTGEGGAVLVHDDDLAERLRRLREHGLVRSPETRPFDDSTETPPWFASMVELGFNYRLTDVAAALGASQLERLEPLTAARRELAARYDAALGDVAELQRPELDPGHAWHLYPVHVAPGERDDLMEFLREGGIGTQLHYYPVPLQPFFREGRAEADFPVSVRHAKSSLSLPLFAELDPADQDRVVAALREWRGR